MGCGASSKADSKPDQDATPPPSTAPAPSDSQKSAPAATQTAAEQSTAAGGSERPAAVTVPEEPPVMICGGLAPAQAGGPIELLEKVRPQAEEKYGKPFAIFEPVEHRTQVVAGTNHYCKVRIAEDEYANLVIFEGLGGEEPQLTGFETEKTESDPVDSGAPEGPVLVCERPAEIAVLEEEPVMICGGLAPAQAGGPIDLLEKVRPQAEEKHGQPFAIFEPVQHRCNTDLRWLLEPNHYCKVRIAEDEYAHLVIFEGLGGEEPQLTGFEAGKTESDPL